MTLAILFTNSQSRADFVTAQLSEHGISLEVVKLERTHTDFTKLGRSIASTVAIVDSNKSPQLIADLVELDASIAVLAIVDKPSVEVTQAMLDAGAKDFVLCPIQPAELVVRVKRLIARVQNSRRNPKSFQSGPYFFDIDGRQITDDGGLVPLTDKEFDLALALFRQAGEVLRRDDLARQIWGHPSLSHSRTMCMTWVIGLTYSHASRKSSFVNRYQNR
jgi:DNA-binding response OmpR family regulator